MIHAFATRIISYYARKWRSATEYVDIFRQFLAKTRKVEWYCVYSVVNLHFLTYPLDL